MKKGDIVNLIKYHMEGKEDDFLRVVNDIGLELINNGDENLANYISTIVAQSKYIGINNRDNDQQQEDPSIQKANKKEESATEVQGEERLYLPDPIRKDLDRIIKAIELNRGLNKFLFEGSPGTGKTKSVEQVGKVLNRQVYKVDFNTLIDSKLGQTQKNVGKLFNELNTDAVYKDMIILFDEIDTLALDRISRNDIREMGRVTSSLLGSLDNLNPEITLFATTNLYHYLDTALIRRFDVIVDFDRYTRDDLINAGVGLYEYYSNIYSFAESNTDLFRKILDLYESVPYPADLKNLIKTSFAFSDSKAENNHLRIFYERLEEIRGCGGETIEELSDKGLTLREIETITGISRSTASRRLKERASGQVGE